MTKLPVNIKIVDRPRVIDVKQVMPSYKSPESNACDLVADILSPILIPARDLTLITTGIMIQILVPGWAAKVGSRSGLSLNSQVRVAQGEGLIDNDYRGEIGVILANDSDNVFTVEPGMRIAQLGFVQMPQAEFNLVMELSRTVRGEGAFGSTGLR